MTIVDAGAETPTPPQSATLVPGGAVPTSLASSVDAALVNATPRVTTSTAKPPQRDGFLDTLRAIALGRVIVWHALGLPIISWFIATMPVMFFVAGTLLHGSLERRPAGIVLRRRLKRLLVPYWLFGAITLSFLSIVHLRGPSTETALSMKQLAWWVLPLRDPSASLWEAGWASSPLWYLRAYLWILLLSPLLMKAWRRFGLFSLLPPFVLMIASHVVSLQGVNNGPGAAIWLFGDFGIYSFFVLLGFAHTCGAFDKLSPRDFAEWTLTFAAVTAVAWHYAPSDDGVVNHSYPTLWAIGLMWISAFHVIRPLIGRATTTRFIGPVVYWSSRRAMSVYLWHSPAIVGSYWLLTKAGVGSSAIPVLVVTVLLTMLASLLTGWIEDVAGGKPGELWPTPSKTNPMRSIVEQARSRVSNAVVAAFAVGAVTSLVLASLALGAGSSTSVAEPAPARGGLQLPPAPSGRPDPLAGNTITTESEPAESTGLQLPPAPSGRPDPQAAVAAADASAAPATAGLANFLDSWRVEHGVQGVAVLASTGDQDPRGTFSGINPDGSAVLATDSFAATSITKTMTAAIILQLVDQGALVLDDPAPLLAAVPDFNVDRTITLRHLLDHSSGLVPYQQAAGYNPGAGLSPLEAVTMSARTPLEWPPGAAGGYSNSGYLALGLLIEQITGQTYETVLSQRILEPYGLTNTSIDNTPTAGWVGSSAGGIVSTVEDLHRWGNALYRDQIVLSPEQVAAMMTVDANLSSGLGAFPVCPCQTTETGTLNYTSIGHNGGSVTMQYAPGTDTLVIASFSQSFWTTSLTQQDVYQLLSDVRSVTAS